MDFKELSQFIDLETQRLYDRFDKQTWTNKEIVLTHAVKLNEEVGELCDEVLASFNSQRSEKMDEHDQENLAHEFADVILVAMLLAKSMNVNVEEAIKHKIIKINQRYQ